MSKSLQHTVQSFGSDCMGNITGYLVRASGGHVVGHFVGNIYEPGSFERARHDALVLSCMMNRPHRKAQFVEAVSEGFGHVPARTVSRRHVALLQAVRS